VVFDLHDHEYTDPLSGRAFSDSSHGPLNRNLLLFRDRRQLVNMSMIGGSGSHREGPWPECVWQKGDCCVNPIAAYAKDLRTRVRRRTDMMVTTNHEHEGTDP
jgi:hypothetical protein